MRKLNLCMLICLMQCFVACRQNKTSYSSATDKIVAAKKKLNIAFLSDSLAYDISSEAKKMNLLKYSIEGKWVNMFLIDCILKNTVAQNIVKTLPLFIIVKNKKFWVFNVEEPKKENFEEDYNTLIPQKKDWYKCGNKNYFFMKDSLLKIISAKETQSFLHFEDDMDVANYMNNKIIDYKKIKRMVTFEEGIADTVFVCCKESVSNKYILCSTDKYTFKYRSDFTYPYTYKGLLEWGGQHFIVFMNEDKSEDYFITRRNGDNLVLLDNNKKTKYILMTN